MSWEDRVSLYRRAGYSDAEIFYLFGIDLRDYQDRFVSVEDWTKEGADQSRRSLYI